MRAPAIVILGLGKGVGASCARKFAESGWSVMIVEDDQKALARAKDDLGDLASYLSENQSTRLGLKNALSGMLEQFDGVDVVLNIPPLSDPIDMDDLTLERVTQELKQTTTTALMAGQVFGREMVAELRAHEDNAERVPYKKSFIQLLSRAAIAGNPGSALNTVTQGSVLSVMKALALEYAPYKIRSNAIVAVRPHSEETESWLKERTPLKRAARASEIAEAAYYLASSEGAYVNGHALELDGGRGVLNGTMPSG